jgi:small-conductance mechanosensitive channel
MPHLRRFLIGLASAATWPVYLAMVAYAAKAGPWPRDLAWPACAVLLSLAGAWFVVVAGRMAFRNGGWAEEVLHAPREVTRQMRRVVLTLAGAGFVLLMPQILLNEGLIAPSGRPIAASTLGRMMSLGFELTCWFLAYRLLRSTSPLLNWLAEDADRLGWAGRHRRALAVGTVVTLGLVLTLDCAGFRFTSKRLIFGGAFTLALAGAAWGTYQLLLLLIANQAWRWKKSPADRAPTSTEATAGTTPPVDDGSDADAKLRTLARIVVSLLGVFGLASIWNVDFALFSYISQQPIGLVVDKQAIRVGDVLAMSLIFFVTAGAWRYLHTFFTLAIFPRMSDDPGIRFAVVTLGRYLVLAVGVLTGLSSIHLGMEKVGVVLAALGVGLGFGLQEIVSNFVSGIILLLERPIRVGDIVTVSGMTGKVDQINIRATTIINGDNQSMIVPNRQFITGNLVNWTHKDKIIRLAIPVNVAHGTDLDKVSDLLLTIAREDADVLNNPVPSAFIDTYGDSAMNFVLSVHVPEPSLMGRVRHRLYGQIQHRFEAAGIVIPLPTRQLHVHSLDTADNLPGLPKPHNRRLDRKEITPPPPQFASKLPLPVPAEDCHRGVDE